MKFRQHPRLGFEPLSVSKDTNAKTNRELINADKFVDKMNSVCQELQDQMLIAQAE